MVGRLAKYLRMAGYDVAYYNDADDDLILDIAVREDRVVLTRDTMMLKRKQFSNGILGSVLIADDNLDEQLLQVCSALGLELEPDLVICLECNSLLEDVDREDLQGKVPPYVYRTQENFKYCANCGRYYWRGTHYDHIKKYFKSLKQRKNRDS